MNGKIIAGRVTSVMPSNPNQTTVMPMRAGLEWATGSDMCAQDVAAKCGPKKGRARHLRQRMPRHDAPPGSRAGWAGMGDWLGTGNVATYLHKYRTFKDVRAFVRKLGLKSHVEWRKLSKSGKS